MTIDELRARLAKMNVHPKFYSLDSQVQDCAYNIELLRDGQYAVYYLERHEKNRVSLHDDMEAACNDLLSRIEFEIQNGMDLSK